MSSTATQQKSGFLRKFLIVMIPILIVLGFVAVMITVIKFNEEPEEKRKPFNTLAVMADYAVSEDVTLMVTAQGEARPRTEIDLVPEVGGKVVYVSPNFIPGGIFRKGETLIRVDDSDYQVALIRAKANVAQAEQVLAREIAEGAVAKKDYEDLGLGGDPSQLALRIPQRQQAEASLLAAKADISAAELQLTRTAVRAPFSGRVRTKSADIGKFVTPGSSLGRIFSNDIVEVSLALSDADLSKLNLPLAFVADSRADAPQVKLSAVVAGQKQNWTGYIMRTDSTYDTQTRALFAIAEVFDPYGKGLSDGGVPLAPGLFISADIAGKVYESTIVIPRDGLRPGNKVYIVNDEGKSEIRDVSVVDTDTKRAVISSGIAQGELVVLSPMEESRTTMTLKVLDVKDPSNILVDPPEPAWMKKAKEGGDKKKKKKSRWSRDKDSESEGPPKRKTDKKTDSKDSSAEKPDGAESRNGSEASEKSSANGGSNE